jgi:cytochrome c
VKDWLHPSSSVKTTVVIDVKMPTIRLTANVTPTSGKAPLAINCQAWADKEGSTNPKMKFVWDFGDGFTAEGMDQKHTFEKTGTYNVLIFVEDQTLGITERKTFKVVVK